MCERVKEPWMGLRFFIINLYFAQQGEKREKKGSFLRYNLTFVIRALKI